MPVVESTPGFNNKLAGAEITGVDIPNPTVKVSPIPTPPVTTNAPVVAEVEAVPEVTANPDTLRISVDGLYTKADSDDNATPEPVAVGLKIKK